RWPPAECPGAIVASRPRAAVSRRRALPVGTRPEPSVFDVGCDPAGGRERDGERGHVPARPAHARNRRGGRSRPDADPGRAESGGRAPDPGDRRSAPSPSAHHTVARPAYLLPTLLVTRARAKPDRAELRKRSAGAAGT